MMPARGAFFGLKPPIMRAARANHLAHDVLVWIGATAVLAELLQERLELVETERFRRLNIGLPRRVLYLDQQPVTGLERCVSAEHLLGLSAARIVFVDVAFISLPFGPEMTVIDPAGQFALPDVRPGAPGFEDFDLVRFFQAVDDRETPSGPRAHIQVSGADPGLASFLPLCPDTAALLCPEALSGAQMPDLCFIERKR